MRRSATLMMAAFAISTTAWAGSGPIEAATPEAFVRSLYAHYGDTQGFDSQTFYSPGLRRLFERNSRLLGGEVGENNDDDELCQCQDAQGLKLVGLVVSLQRPHKADARVRFVVGEARDGVSLKLVLTPLGWRIDDVIHSRKGRSSSLRARLVEENRRLGDAAARRR